MSVAKSAEKAKANSNKEEDQVLPPGIIIDSKGRKLYRMACRARGVSADHNPQTAYLLIPEDAVHSQLLYCSHKECTRLKRSFRYCAVCRQAVANRNFVKRHHHGLLQFDESGKAIFPEDVERNNSHSSSSSSNNNNNEVTVSDTTSSSNLREARQQGQQNSSSSENKSDEKSSSEQPETKRRRRESPNRNAEEEEDKSGDLPNNVAYKRGNDDSANDDTPSGLSSDSHGNERPVSVDEQQWLDLYRARPQATDNKVTAEWLSKVVGMGVSVLTKGADSQKKQRQGVGTSDSGSRRGSGSGSREVARVSASDDGYRKQRATDSTNNKTSDGNSDSNSWKEDLSKALQHELSRPFAAAAAAAARSETATTIATRTEGDKKNEEMRNLEANRQRMSDESSLGYNADDDD